MKKLSIILSLLTLVSVFSMAQVNIPRPSPGATVMQKVGLADVTISYSRPSMKGRKVFGDVVPFGKIWRTGANEPTKISFSDTVTIEGTMLPGGEYALYTIPGETEWTVILGKNTKTSAQDFKDGEEAAKFKVKPTKTAETFETLTFDFYNVTTSSADITLSWENTRIQLKVSNEVDKRIMADIKQKIDNNMVYYQAASYYLETNRDLKQALDWVNIATAKDAKFWQLHTKAKIQAKMGDCKGAIESAQKSIELAKVAKNDEYVKMNEKLIEECKKKK